MDWDGWSVQDLRKGYEVEGVAGEEKEMEMDAYGLASILREVVAGEELAGHASVHAGPAVVRSFNNGILEATRVLQVQMKLTVLGVICLSGAWADVCLE